MKQNVVKLNELFHFLLDIKMRRKFWTTGTTWKISEVAKIRALLKTKPHRQREINVEGMLEILMHLFNMKILIELLN
jgi:hypothetical protein